MKSGFSFVVVNDLHYRDARCGDWLERVAKSIRTLHPRPAFCFLDGDLSEDGTREQLGAVREIFKPLPLPVKAVAGNHDCSDDGRHEAFDRLFRGADNFHFDVDGWHFLALDTTEGRAVYRTKIGDATFAWVDGELRRFDKSRPLVVLTHFPLGRNWLRPRNAAALVGRLKERDLRAVLSGHWHGNTERQEAGAFLSTSRCCSWWRENHDGSDLKGYTLCRVAEGHISHEFVALV